MRGGKNRTSARPMGVKEASQARRGVAIQGVKRLVEEPQRRARTGDAGQCRSLELARRQQPDGDVGEEADAQSFHRGSG